MSWFLAFVGFAVLIMLHEAGHFAAAKAVGMRVERFSLFFPPLAVRKKVGETEYALGTIPLGGYVKISGMNPDEKLPDEVRTRAYYSQPVWKRVVVIAAGPLVNVILAAILLFAFFWQVGPRETAVGPIQKGFPAQQVLEQGDVIVAVDGKKTDRVSTLQRIVRTHEPGETIEVDVMRERAVAEKEAVVTEEVGVRKEAVERTQQVQGTVRKEELVVEGEGDVVEGGRAPGAPATGTSERERGRRA